MSFFFPQLGHEACNFNCRLGRLRSAIDFVLQATFARLRFVFQTQDRIDHRNTGFDRDALKRIGNRASQILSMLGAAFDDDTNSDDSIRFFLLCQFTYDDGDFKRSGHLIKREDCVRHLFEQLLRSVIHQPLHIRRIELARDDDKSAPARDYAGFVCRDRQRGRVGIAR